MINYYKILEIPDFSDDQTIKKAYRTLSKKYHPDVNRSEQAHQYFIVIKEAYEYLSDPKNKRWLDEILIRQKQIKNQSTEYARKESQSGNNWPPPKIHYFKSNTSFYSLDDIVVIEWQVEGAKSVDIDYLGTVNAMGKHGLKLKRVEEELVVSMRVTGFDNQHYYRKLVFKYRDKNPNVEAWRRQRTINPNVRQEHFKKENIFGVYGRVPVETFRQRIIVATVFLAVMLWLSFWQQWTFVFYLSLFVYVFFINVTFSKRLHDLNTSWSEVFLPNPFNGIKTFFTRRGIQKTNDYGPYRPPKYLHFKDAHRKIISRFKKWTFPTKLAVSVTLLSIILPMIPYLQPVKQGSFYKAELYSSSTTYYLVLDDEIHLPIDYKIFRSLRNGGYNSMKINRLMLTKEIASVEFISNKQSLTKTVYYGFIGTRPAVLMVLVFLLLLEWQLIQSFNKVKNQNQLSQIMWLICFILLIVWLVL